MTTWLIKFTGTLTSTRKLSGSPLKGEIEVRATSLDEALQKFNLVFSAPMVRIISIVEVTK